MKTAIYIDEAGRGPLAGPVYVGLILTLGNFDTSELNDSKQLSHKKRLQAMNKIADLESEGKLLYSIGTASNNEIDELGIKQSLKISILRGLYHLMFKYYQKYLEPRLDETNIGKDIINIIEMQSILNKGIIDEDSIDKLIKHLNNFVNLKTIFIDGNTDFGLNLDINIKTIIDGDAINPYIGGASIIAKTARDQYMTDIHSKYPQYMFDQHKGYGTKKHRQAISEHGPCQLHRLSFLSNIIGEQNIKRKKIIKCKSDIKLDFKKPKLLLHVCCAPDLTYPLEYLSQYFDLYVLWYNPNITDPQEHIFRLGEYQKFIKKSNISEFKIDYNPQEFFDLLVKNAEKIGIQDKDKKTILEKLGSIPEKGDRCYVCYLSRLMKTDQIAEKYNIQYFSTTLSISPHKDRDKIMDTGIQAQNQSRFLFFDFQKNGGYKKSLELTKKYNIKRQNYCGCIWSQNNLK